MATQAAPKQIPIVCPGHSRPLAEVIYSPPTPDGVFLISGCHAKTPMIRRGDTGDWIGTFQGHKGAVWGVALDDTAQLAATASADFSARLWDAITGDMIHEFPHKHIVKSVEFSKDRSTLASVGHEGIVRLFDVAKPETDPETIVLSETKTAGQKVLIHVRWGKDPNTLLAGSADGAIRVYDSRSKEKVQEIKVDGGVMDLEVSRSLDIVTVAAGSSVSFFDARTYQLLKCHKMPINFKEEGGASLHPSGDRFIAGGSDLWVRTFSYETGEEMECLKGHHGPVRCMRYHPNGKHYATGSEDGTIRLWASGL
ncbi:unnamed protein product [Chrysoparadoxa australica]